MVQKARKKVNAKEGVDGWPQYDTGESNKSYEDNKGGWGIRVPGSQDRPSSSEPNVVTGTATRP